LTILRNWESKETSNGEYQAEGLWIR